jgi:hypothetical protein
LWKTVLLAQHTVVGRFGAELRQKGTAAALSDRNDGQPLFSTACQYQRQSALSAGKALNK